MTYHKHISAQHNPWDLKIKEVIEYRDLIFLFVKRAFQASYKQTILGPLWLFISPLATSLVYVVLFGNIAHLSTEGAPQLLFYLTSTALWSYFSSNLGGNSSTFLSNAGLFGRVYFPRLTVPISGILIQTVKFGIQMILVLILLAVYTAKGAVSPKWIEWLLIPFILMHLGLLGMGIGILVSSITTKYRDLASVASFVFGLWMYATPVVYPISQIPSGWLRTLLIWNPVSAPIELFRHAILGNGTIMIGSLIYSLALTTAVVIAGIVVFNKVERNFMDII